MADKAGLFKYVSCGYLSNQVLTIQIRCEIHRDQTRHHAGVHGQAATGFTRKQRPYAYLARGQGWKECLYP